MEKTKEIWKRIQQLYKNCEPTDELIEETVRKCPEKYNQWDEAFSEYPLDAVLEAIDAYFKGKTNKSQPKIVDLLKALKGQKKEEKKESKPIRCINPESYFMSRDVELGRNIDCLLSDYKRAVDYIMNDKLIELIGNTEFVKIRYDYQTKYTLAVNNGLFNGFDDILRGVKCNTL